MPESNSRGGGYFVFEGELGQVKDSTNKETGVVRTGAEMRWFGGSRYMSFDSARIPAKCRQGPTWAVIRCQIREFQERTYPADPEILSIDGEKVSVTK